VNDTRLSNERVANSSCGVQKVRTAYWRLLLWHHIVDGIGRMLHNFLARRVAYAAKDRKGNQQTSKSPGVTRSTRSTRAVDIIQALTISGSMRYRRSKVMVKEETLFTEVGGRLFLVDGAYRLQLVVAFIFCTFLASKHALYEKTSTNSQQLRENTRQSYFSVVKQRHCRRRRRTAFGGR
jgi:hypothetical protein